MIPELLEVIALVTSGVVAGVLFAVAVSVLPALFALPAGRYIETHRLLGKGYHPTMPIVVNVAMVADLWLGLVAEDSASRALFVVAGVLLLASQFVSHLGNVPINRRVKAVDPEAVPEGWQDPRPLWRGWHLLRTTLALVALAANAVGVVLS
ncbi:putative membrane protein [Nonomuraea polychroma]|uniref:Putative membrane protein n=1 Tax=Nonomuraea polychroma TaxID=46176 RepID=A0A438MED6_9ACTN|nr:DUF1772 domain-containing protein [Nonomuraea polychroma]RVX44153.1 putative membrane protein [Nonomuraea polychroma]